MRRDCTGCKYLNLDEEKQEQFRAIKKYVPHECLLFKTELFHYDETETDIKPFEVCKRKKTR